MINAVRRDSKGVGSGDGALDPARRGEGRAEGLRLPDMGGRTIVACATFYQAAHATLKPVATMSKTARMVILTSLGVGLWTLATLYIRFVPAAFTSPLHSALSFVTALPIGWLCVRLIARSARLQRTELVAGTAFVGAIAMMIDGLALRFFPWVYSGAAEIFRPASAWLLWGYGVSLAIALWLAREAGANPSGLAARPH